MPPSRSTQVAGPSKLPVMRLRPKPTHSKKPVVKPRIPPAPPPVMLSSPPHEPPAAQSGLFTPPEDLAAENARDMLISPPPEDTLRMPFRPSLAVRLASEEPPFSLGSDSTFHASPPAPSAASSKRKRTPSAFSPPQQPAPLPHATPNPKPRKQSRRDARTRSLSPTHEHSSPTRRRNASRAESSDEDSFPPVPSTTKKPAAGASSARGSATPVRYEPPTERPTTPKAVVFSRPPPSTAKPKPKLKSPAARLSLPSPNPLDVFTDSHAPPSPSEDPLLLQASPPTQPSPRARPSFGRTASRSPVPSPLPKVAREAPRFLSDSPPETRLPAHAQAQAHGHTTESSPPDDRTDLPAAVPARDDSPGPPSSDSEPDADDRAPVFDLFGGSRARKAAEAEDLLASPTHWPSTFPASSPLTKGRPEGAGEDEFTGRFMVVSVPTRSDPPTVEESVRMERWGRPVSPFPGSPVGRRYSWLVELEGGEAGREKGEDSGEGGQSMEAAEGDSGDPFDFGKVPSPTMTPARPRRSEPRRASALVREEPARPAEAPDHPRDADPDESHSAPSSPAQSHSTPATNRLSMTRATPLRPFHSPDKSLDADDEEEANSTRELDDEENIADASFASYDEPLRGASDAEPEAEEDVSCETDADASAEIEEVSAEQEASAEEEVSAASLDPFDFQTARDRASASPPLASPPRVAPPRASIIVSPRAPAVGRPSAPSTPARASVAQRPSAAGRPGTPAVGLSAPGTPAKSSVPGTPVKVATPGTLFATGTPVRLSVPGTPARPSAPGTPAADVSASTATTEEASEDAQDETYEGVSEEVERLEADISRRYSVVGAGAGVGEREWSVDGEEDEQRQKEANVEERADEVEESEEEDARADEVRFGRQMSDHGEMQEQDQSLEEEEEEDVQDSLYIDPALSKESPTDDEGRYNDHQEVLEDYDQEEPQNRYQEEELPVSRPRPSHRSSSRASRASHASPPRARSRSHQPEPSPQVQAPAQSGSFTREDSFEDMYEPEPPSAPSRRPVRYEASFEMGEPAVVEPADEEHIPQEHVSHKQEPDEYILEDVPDDRIREPGTDHEGDTEMVPATYGDGLTDTESEDEVDPNLVTITSEDPKAAARAAAILKMYDYDCLPHVLARRRRDSQATLNALLRNSNRKSVSASGVSKYAGDASRSRSLGGVIGDKVFIPGSPAMTLPELLNQAEVELEHDPGVIEHERTIIENSPVKGLFSLPGSRASSVGVQDGPVRASSNPLMTPHRELVGLPPEYYQETPGYPSAQRREWAKEDWKAMDTCFTDERLDVGHRLGLAEGEMAEVDEVNLEDVVDRFAGTLEGAALGWDRTMLLTRAKVLAKKHRAGHFAPPTPNGSRQSSIVSFPGAQAVDMTPMPRALERRQSMSLNDKGKMPATLLAPRYSHLMDEAIASTNEYHAALNGQGEPRTTEAHADERDTTPPRELTSMEPPQTIGRRVKGWFTSFRSPTPSSPARETVQLRPVPASEDDYVRAADIVDRNRAPIDTPAPKEQPRAAPHRELVDLDHVPTPAPKAAVQRVAQRLVDLRPVSPPAPTRQGRMPRVRKGSSGSVKDLVQSFEEMERREEEEAEKRRRSERAWKTRGIGRLRGVKGGAKGKPVWKP